MFFIFLVANIGGSLTPLGDPPLFLGFLKGVDFLWTLHAMLAPMLFTGGILLALFYVIDRRAWSPRDGGGQGQKSHRTPTKRSREQPHVLYLVAVARRRDRERHLEPRRPRPDRLRASRFPINGLIRKVPF